jgi:3-hydroxyacyl-CoA dehydrogenase
MVRTHNAFKVLTEGTMQKLLIAALLATAAIVPAVAKDKNNHAVEQAEERIDRLQERLESDDINDRQRDKIEDRIDDIADKFGVTLPTPDRPICNIDPLVYCDEQ